MTTRIIFPAFSSDAYQPFEMRQLVSALELRFQQLEDSSIGSTIPTVEDSLGEFAPLEHTHVEADILDLQDYLLDITNQSIFDLIDTPGAAGEGDVLVYRTGLGAFAAEPQGASSLNDLTDVSVPLPNDGDVLTYNAIASQWEALGSGTGITSLADLTDTDLTGQIQFDMLYNATGTEWRDTAGALQWNPVLQFLSLAFDYSINWYDSTGSIVEMLVMEGDPSVVSSEWGTVGTDWTYVGPYNITTMRSTGVYQSFTATFGADIFHVSDDGLQVLIGGNADDDVYSFTLDSPYDFENATQTGSRALTNPWYSGQWINSGNAYMIQVAANSVSTYPCPSPYTVDSSAASATVTNAALGFPTSGETSYWMPRDGTLLIGCGDDGTNNVFRVFSLSTPYDITSYSLLYNQRMDNLTNGPTGQFQGYQFSDDGLTVIGIFNRRFWIGTMSAAYDVTTLSFAVGADRNVQTDSGDSFAAQVHVSPDGNSLYVLSDENVNGTIYEYTKTTPNPALLGEGLTVGDENYITRIDGSSVDVTATDFNVTATNVDINGVDPSIHLGEVTGGQSLTVEVTSITNRTDIGVECDPADDLAIHDDDVGDLKRLNASVITDAGNF
jgi:hypothetical protein